MTRLKYLSRIMGPDKLEKLRDRLAKTEGLKEIEPDHAEEIKEELENDSRQFEDLYFEYIA